MKFYGRFNGIMNFWHPAFFFCDKPSRSMAVVFDSLNLLLWAFCAWLATSEISHHLVKKYTGIQKLHCQRNSSLTAMLMSTICMQIVIWIGSMEVGFLQK